MDNCKSIKLIKKDKKLINQIPKEIKKTESPRILENEENIAQLGRITSLKYLKIKKTLV